MATTNVPTPKTLEPQADYAIQVDIPGAAPAATTTTASATAASPPARKGVVARVARIDEHGDRFDAHDIRIGRWESEPCGDDFCNFVVSFACPFVSAAQISHRMGGSYSLVLICWGIVYCVALIAATHKFPATYVNVRYESVAGHTSIQYVGSEGVDQASNIVWNLVISVTGLLWIFVNLYLRLSVRDRFQIPGNCCCDCCCVWWCSFCSLTQLSTHVKSYRPNSCDLRAVDALPGYDEEETAAAK